MLRKIVTLTSLIAVLIARGSEIDYTQGVFIVNEDWYGHNNSTVNYLSPDDADENYWSYRVIQTENPGIELGCTNQFGAIYNGRFYFIAKQQRDPGASIIGGRITVADAKTMKVIKQLQFINPAESGNDGGLPSANYTDGRGFIGVNADKGYISTSDGIWILDLNSLEVTGVVNGTTNDTGSLYLGQTGTMESAENKVFVASQSSGVLVINSETDELTDIIDFKEIGDNASVGSLVKSKDGNIWASVATDASGSGATEPYLVRIDPATLSKEVISLPENIYAPKNSWYAWTPDGFCTSTQNNVLYWNGGSNTWFAGAQIFKYDIDKNEFSCIIDLAEEGEGWQLYGCSMRVHPQTDEMYISLYKNFSSPVYKLRRTDADGNTIKEYPMIENYWFPSIPVFPESAQSSGEQPTIVTQSGVISIYSLSGVLIRQADVSEYNKMISTLPSGVYVVNDGCKTIKIKL